MTSSYIQHVTNNLCNILNDPNGARCIFCLQSPVITTHSKIVDVSTVVCPLCNVDAVVPASLVTSESLILQWHQQGFGKTCNYGFVKTYNYFYDFLPIDIQNYIHMIINVEYNIEKYILRSHKIKNIQKNILPFVSKYIKSNNVYYFLNNWENHIESVTYLFNYDFVNAIVDSYHYDFMYNNVNFWHKLLSVIYKLIFYSKFGHFCRSDPDYARKYRTLDKFVLLLCKKYNFKLHIFVRDNNNNSNSLISNIYATDLDKPIPFDKLLGFVKIYQPYKKKDIFSY